MLTMMMAHVALLDRSSRTPTAPTGGLPGGEVAKLADPQQLLAALALKGLKLTQPDPDRVCAGLDVDPAIGVVLGTVAIQKASKGAPRSPKTRNRERHPNWSSRIGDKMRPIRFPAMLHSQARAC